MKIGINTYLACDSFGDGFLVGVGEMELAPDEVIRIFGYTLKYHEVVKLLESNESNKDEKIVKKFGAVTMKIFKIEV